MIRQELAAGRADTEVATAERRGRAARAPAAHHASRCAARARCTGSTEVLEETGADHVAREGARGLRRDQGRAPRRRDALRRHRARDHPRGRPSSSASAWAGATCACSAPRPTARPRCSSRSWRPALRSRNPERRKEAVEALENLAAIASHLKHLLLDPGPAQARALSAAARAPRGLHPGHPGLPEAGDRLQGHHAAVPRPRGARATRSTGSPSTPARARWTTWSRPRRAASCSAPPWPRRPTPGFILARKPGKLPRDGPSVEYELEYGVDALEVHARRGPRRRPGAGARRPARHGRHRAARCASLVEQAGGVVAGCAFVIELAFLHGRERLRRLRRALRSSSTTPSDRRGASGRLRRRPTEVWRVVSDPTACRPGGRACTRVEDASRRGVDDGARLAQGQGGAGRLHARGGRGAGAPALAPGARRVAVRAAALVGHHRDRARAGRRRTARACGSRSTSGRAAGRASARSSCARPRPEAGARARSTGSARSCSERAQPDALVGLGRGRPRRGAARHGRRRCCRRSSGSSRRAPARRRGARGGVGCPDPRAAGGGARAAGAAVGARARCATTARRGSAHAVGRSYPDLVRLRSGRRVERARRRGAARLRRAGGGRARPPARERGWRWSRSAAARAWWAAWSRCADGFAARRLARPAQARPVYAWSRPDSLTATLEAGLFGPEAERRLGARGR